MYEGEEPNSVRNTPSVATSFKPSHKMSLGIRSLLKLQRYSFIIHSKYNDIIFRAAH